MEQTRNIHIFLVEQSTESGHLVRRHNLRGCGVDSVGSQKEISGNVQSNKFLVFHDVLVISKRKECLLASTQGCTM